MQLPLEHAAEFRRCLETLDAVAIRKLWTHIAPGMPQPKSDDEALHTMHLARVRMIGANGLPTRAVEYSKDWLRERETRRLANAVGIAVKDTSGRRAAQTSNIREAMRESVLQSVQAGIDLDVDAREVNRRMLIARDKA